MGSEIYLNNGVFSVNLYGMELNFCRISGLGASVEYDTYIEGGGRVNIIPKPSSSAGTITFEKGITTLKWDAANYFAVGTELFDITISLVKNGVTAESYNIESGIVTAWELGSLDALATGVAVKKFTLAHTGIMIL